jgi:hypothetical protein
MGNGDVEERRWGITLVVDDVERSVVVSSVWISWHFGLGNRIGVIKVHVCIYVGGPAQVWWTAPRPTYTDTQRDWMRSHLQRTTSENIKSVPFGTCVDKKDWCPTYIRTKLQRTDFIFSLAAGQIFIFALTVAGVVPFVTDHTPISLALDAC